MSLENIKSEAERSKKTITVISLVIFILGTLAVFFISVFITKPLKNMVQTIEEISAGDLSKRVAVLSHDEVGNLAASFNAMVAKLENFSRELKDLNNELEDKVAKRTKKLEIEVNERCLAEEALKESEGKYRRLVDNSLVGIYITEDHYIQFCNRRFAEIFGYREPREVTGKHFRKLVTEDSWPLVAERKLYDNSAINNIHYECKGLKKDGKVFDIEVFDSSVIYNGKPVIEGILIDITGRKRAEEERKKLEEQLRHALKMESIGVLAGGIAHDFNNILSAVIGYTELTLGCVPPESSAKYNLDRIFFASNRAKEMIKRILTFSRKEEGGRKPLFLKEVIEDMLKLIRATLPTTIEIQQNIETSINTVMATESEIHQVLLNLCTNAEHAMRAEGGILTVSLKEVFIEPGSDEINLRPGKYQQLIVSDTGHGMTPEIMERMFDPYFTTKKEGEGTGMGLSVVHGIIKSSGGDIVVYSNPGKGTTMHVFWPVTYEKLKEIPIPVIKKTPISQGKNETILVVDDEPFIAELNKEIIEDLGYQVIMETGGPEALASFQADPDKIDLVITDQVMPHMTGVQLAREVKKIKPIPVILCSGFTDRINEDNYKAFGVDAFLLKPILQNELAETINLVLGSRESE
jgi:PAS domain S-box-containing protein